MTNPPGVATAAALPWFRRESWLAVSSIGCILLVLAMYADGTLQRTLMATGGILFVIAVVLLVRREREVARVETAEQPAVNRTEY